MSDNYSKNLDAAVRRSVGVRHPLKGRKSAQDQSREAALRLRRERERDRRRAEEEDLIEDDDELLTLEEAALELSEEELREYAALLSDMNEEEPARKTPEEARQALGINGAESLGGAYTNERFKTGEAKRADKDEVNALLKSAHGDHHHDDERDGGAEESETTRKTKKQRELVAKIFVSAIVLAMMAAAFWPG